jgi:predicted DNA binding CopG/RHH family protein
VDLSAVFGISSRPKKITNFLAICIVIWQNICMKKKRKYSDEPIELEVIDNFLPTPEKLALKDENIKVTITLSKESVNFFKKVAGEKRFPYQKMIRRVLDHYVARYKSA